MNRDKVSESESERVRKTISCGKICAHKIFGLRFVSTFIVSITFYNGIAECARTERQHPTQTEWWCEYTPQSTLCTSHMNLDLVREHFMIQVITFCRLFFSSLRQTISLCTNAPDDVTLRFSSSIAYTLHRNIIVNLRIKCNWRLFFYFLSASMTHELRIRPELTGASSLDATKTNKPFSSSVSNHQTLND